MNNLCYYQIPHIVASKSPLLSRQILADHHTYVQIYLEIWITVNIISISFLFYFYVFFKCQYNGDSTRIFGNSEYTRDQYNGHLSAGKLGTTSTKGGVVYKVNLTEKTIRWQGLMWTGLCGQEHHQGVSDYARFSFDLFFLTLALTKKRQLVWLNQKTKVNF